MGNIFQGFRTGAAAGTFTLVLIAVAGLLLLNKKTRGITLGLIIGLAILAVLHYGHVWTRLGFKYN